MATPSDNDNDSNIPIIVGVGMLCASLLLMFPLGPLALIPSIIIGPLAYRYLDIKLAIKPVPEVPTADQTLNLIKKRRSVFPKDFTGGKVPKESLKKMLDAANWAPTHNLTEPWRFVVLEGDAKLRFEDLTIDLLGMKLPESQAQATVAKLVMKWEKTWPLVSCYIAICMKKVVTAKSGKRNPEWEDLCSVGAAVQNMSLCATSLGVASYWSSWQELARDSTQMKDFLGLSAEDRCLGVLTVGMSDRMGAYRGTRKPYEDKVTWK